MNWKVCEKYIFMFVFGLKWSLVLLFTFLSTLFALPFCSLLFWLGFENEIDQIQYQAGNKLKALIKADVELYSYNYNVGD